MRFSIVVPAHDEERYLGGCLDSIRRAAASFGSNVEVIVVLNRCTDGTEQMARDWGARLVREDARNLARIRNAGAARAVGEILLTIDADSRMSPNMLGEVNQALRSGKYVGGGVPVRPERISLGIALTLLVLKAGLLLTGLGGGLFWCYRRDFEAVGGFNERLSVAEDLEFAKRLKDYGKKRKLKFHTLHGTYITTSCRKFDRFGDWFAFRFLLFHWKEMRQELKGVGHTFADRYFYDFEHNTACPELRVSTEAQTSKSSNSSCRTG